METEALVDYVVIYPDTNGEWRWSARAGNNETIADSGEGYKQRSNVVEAVGKLFPGAIVKEHS